MMHLSEFLYAETKLFSLYLSFGKRSCCLWFIHFVIVSVLATFVWEMIEDSRLLRKGMTVCVKMYINTKFWCHFNRLQCTSTITSKCDLKINMNDLYLAQYELFFGVSVWVCIPPTATDAAAANTFTKAVLKPCFNNRMELFDKITLSLAKLSYGPMIYCQWFEKQYVSVVCYFCE